jgi:hypothetical protein
MCQVQARSSQRPDADGDAEEMQYPLLHDTAQRLVGRPAEVQADHEIVTLVARPVNERILGVEDVELHSRERGLRLDDQPAEAAEGPARSVHLDRFQISEHHRPVVGARLLLPEKQFRRARLERVLATFQHAANDDLR